MNKIINNLKSTGMIGIKTSFEDEGQTFDNMIKLQKITSENNMKLVIKIGGAEAKTDIKMAEKLCANAVIAPMVETQYSVNKFINCNTLLDKGINVETFTACNNIKEILKEGDTLSYITIGRVDLVGSLQKSRKEINSDEIYNIVEKTFKSVRQEYGSKIKICLGGSIDKNSFNFINKLNKSGLIDYAETRFIIFDVNKLLNNFNYALYNAHKFELEWLKYQNNNESEVLNQRIKRQKMIDTRLKNF